MEWMFLAAIFIGIVIGFKLLAESSDVKPKVQRCTAKKCTSDTAHRPVTHEQSQIEAVKRYTYTTKPLLNYTEGRVYWILIKLLRHQYKIHAQVNLGEILHCADEQGFRAINTKRSDFVITDNRYTPIALIEYHGSGHFQGDFAIRDETKKRAAESAGVKYIPMLKADEISIKDCLVQAGLLTE